MKRVFVNEDRCVGCHLCEYNCAFAALNVENKGNAMARALKGKSINPRVRVEGGVENVCFAVSCRHCLEPLCVRGCLTGALSINGGVIEIDKDKCVHCFTCVLSCPYGCVAPSADGAVQKCELCLKSVTGTPACVAGCPNAAIVYEERD